MNMSYCRYRNTLGDLEDCHDHLDDKTDDLHDDEKKARLNLIDLCCAIAEEYKDEVEDRL